MSFSEEPSEAYLFPRLIAVFFLGFAAWNAARAIGGKSRVGDGLDATLVRRLLPGLLVAVLTMFVAAKWLGYYTAGALAFFIIVSLYDPAPHTRAASWARRLFVTAGFMAVIWRCSPNCCKSRPRAAFFTERPTRTTPEEKIMKTLLHRLTRLLAAMAAGTLIASAALAADFPDRPIGVMVSYGAGGATDFQARIVTMVSGNDDLLGQPMYIINKPGAGGRVGWNWFATEADADGYTLAAYNVPHFIAQSIKGGVKYSADSFEPIANWGADPAAIVVGADSPYNTVQELVEYASANPGKVTLSGAGLFVGHHIAALQLEKATGAKFAYIPTKGGGAAAMKAVIGGDVVGGINNLSDAFRAREAGNVKILAIADLERNDFLPDVPTLMEAGYEVDNASVNFRGLMVPAGTPQDVIDALAAKVPAMFEHSRVASKMKAGGSPMRIMGREEVQAMWAKRQETLAELLEGL